MRLQCTLSLNPAAHNLYYGHFDTQVSSQTKVLVCCNSQVPVPTSAGQVPSNDNCLDVEIEATKARTGLKLADLRTLNEVFAFMELKSSRCEWYAAEAQVLRRLYRMTSTHPIRRWVFAATMCGCYLRVYVQTPAGIVHTTPINCASPNGLRILKRTILRILNGDLDWKIRQAGGQCGWEIPQ
ncbi:BQ5605_C004g02618 [Microbotryum silenes-dioicae]|uniref:BQ5605_C004g02618 protein n=1 Tax=Microbotryum silenes-dioicae TaxID=796604 RepID=A0A2X0MCS4_9BASI|nr:BQ5605_C004g02618 [Microbotryum silenes-dioicae]